MRCRRWIQAGLWGGSWPLCVLAELPVRSRGDMDRTRLDICGRCSCGPPHRWVREGQRRVEREMSGFWALTVPTHSSPHTAGRNGTPTEPCRAGKRAGTWTGTWAGTRAGMRVGARVGTRAVKRAGTRVGMRVEMAKPCFIDFSRWSFNCSVVA